MTLQDTNLNTLALLFWSHALPLIAYRSVLFKTLGLKSHLAQEHNKKVKNNNVNSPGQKKW